MKEQVKENEGIEDYRGEGEEGSPVRFRKKNQQSLVIVWI
jgi:hypothetical protein